MGKHLPLHEQTKVYHKDQYYTLFYLYFKSMAYFISPSLREKSYCFMQMIPHIYYHVIKTETIMQRLHTQGLQLVHLQLLKTKFVKNQILCFL